MKIEYYNGISNEEFVKYFKELLYSVTELTQYSYPYEKVEPQESIDDHIVRCQNSLFEHILHSVRESAVNIEDNIAEDELLFIYNKKKTTLLPLLTDLIVEYINSVKVNYIALNGN